MTVADRDPEEKRCANAACTGGALKETKGGKYWKCGECLRLTCIDCKVVHEGENCRSYQSGRTHREKGTAVNESAEASSSTGDDDRGACGGKVVAGNDAGPEEEAEAKARRREKARMDPFVPGKAYFCGAHSCTYETVLHKGSCKFWCPWCYTRHEIEDGILFRYKQE